MPCVCDRITECPGWEKSYRHLNDAVIFYNKRFGGPYTGIQFKFCPFCGRPITEEMGKSRKIG